MMRDHATLPQMEAIGQQAEKPLLQLKILRVFSAFYPGKRGKQKMMVHIRLPKKWKLPLFLHKDLSDLLGWVFEAPMEVIPILISLARHWVMIETATL